MQQICFIFLMALLLSSRPFFWGAESSRAKKASDQIRAVAPKPNPEEWADFTRSLVIRDRTVVIGAFGLALIIEIFLLAFDTRIPSTWMIVNAETTTIVVVLTAIQMASAVIMSVFSTRRAFSLTRRPSKKSIARLNTARLKDYAPKSILLFPPLLLALSFTVNLLTITVLGATSRNTTYSSASILTFVLCTLISLVAYGTCLFVINRSTRAKSNFGLFFTDLVRMDSLSALLALSAGSAAISLMVTFATMTAQLTSLDQQARSAIAAVLIVGIIIMYALIFRMTLFSANPASLQKLWALENDDQKNA